MNLEQLENRKLLLDDDIQTTTNNLFVLHGHKAEVVFQIQELQSSLSPSSETIVNDEFAPVGC